MIDSDLIYYLLSDASILALIGTSASPVVARIYPEVLPEGTQETSITYTLISSDNPEFLSGAADLAVDLYQMSCWATTALAANTLANLVKARMQGIGGYNFQKTEITDRRSDYEPETLLYRRDVDFTISY